MLRYILLTLGLFVTISLTAQDTAYPAFVLGGSLDWFEKEVGNYNSYLADLKVAEAADDQREVRNLQARMKGLLDKFDFNCQFIELQLASHLDLEKIKAKKQEWVDGTGFEYYLQLERLRSTKTLSEIQLTMAQYDEFTSGMTELRALRSAYDSASKSADYAQISNDLKKAGTVLQANESLLIQ